MKGEIEYRGPALMRRGVAQIEIEGARVHVGRRDCPSSNSGTAVRSRNMPIRPMRQAGGEATRRDSNRVVPDQSSS
ncbi:MAG: hypothetical protein INR71_03015 [Terriglobus roseus]|nr:hypothetical protein [Terriglobus roseus]